MVRLLGKSISKVAHAYYRGPDFPLKLRLWEYFRRLVHHARMTVRYAADGWITLDERDLLQREIFVRGFYEPEIWEALSCFAREEEVFWDVGAHIGSFAIRGALDSRVREVHAFEPDPLHFAVLEFNLSLNGTKYRTHPFALGDRFGAATLHQGPEANTGLSSLASEHDPGCARVEVQCRTIDGMVFDEGVAGPTLMKIDVEGWEAAVLRGARRLLADRPPKAIVIECACDDTGRLKDPTIAETLGRAGYLLDRIRRPSGVIDVSENYLAVRS